MHPVLIVDGVAYDVEGIDFYENKPTVVKICKDGKSCFYYNDKKPFMPETIDFDRFLVWK